MFEIRSDVPTKARIKIVGVGGCGCNAVNQMYNNGLKGVEFVCMNTDEQQLKELAVTSIQLGLELTHGLGAGGNPEIGKKAASIDEVHIAEALAGSDMVFVVAGMGGGTGTGGAPVVAEIARDMGILTVAIVTKPFLFEGSKRAAVADLGIKELQERADLMISISNEKVLTSLGDKARLQNAYDEIAGSFLGIVRGITDLLVRPGMINVDFADVRNLMSDMGIAIMGVGAASGEDRAKQASKAAIHSLLLEGFNLQNASGILVNITAGVDLSLGEFSDVGDMIEASASDSATVIVGTVIDPEMRNELRISVFFIGFSESNSELSKTHQVTSENPKTRFVPAIKGIKLISSEDAPDDELVEVISHLSNVYKSIGGDELEIQSVTTIPPNPKSDSIGKWIGKLRGVI